MSRFWKKFSKQLNLALAGLIPIFFRKPAECANFGPFAKPEDALRASNWMLVDDNNSIV